MSEVPAPPPRKSSCLLKGLFVVALILLAAGIFWWWTNRPISPVVLSPAELQTVERKVEAMRDVEPAAPPEPEYEVGKRVIELSERELNGMLNEHTTLGESVKFELGTDVIHARVETDLSPDLPILGGKTLKARARFLVKEDESGASFVIDDVTVWGISMPNDWLGGLKGKDLIGEALGGKLAGVKSVQVLPGEIRIELKE